MRTLINRLYRQRLQKENTNKVPELVSPQLEITDFELENILRWEDDGGQINEVAKSTVGSRSNHLLPVNRVTHETPLSY
jgi:hypothetical protein